MLHTVPQQLEAVRGLLHSCSRGRTAGLLHNVPVLLQPAVNKSCFSLYASVNVQQGN